MPIKITAKTEAAKAKLKQILDGLTPENTDPIVDEAARRTQAGLVSDTPKRWFGQARAGWLQPDSVTKPAPGVRVVQWSAPEGVASPIMLWLEEGTRRHGPVVAKRLFVPLTKRAALWFMAASGYTSAQRIDNRAAYKTTVVGPTTAIRKEYYDNVNEDGTVSTLSRMRRRKAIEVRGSIVKDGETRAVPRTLVYGVDYVLKKEVAGIAAQHIVANFRPKSRDILKNLMIEYIQKLIKS